MTERKYNYSVILNNYMRPSDRFMAGGYALAPDARTTTDLIDLAGRQGLVKGIEFIQAETPGAIGVGVHNQSEIKAALEANGLVMAGLIPNLWAVPRFQWGTLSSPDAAIRRESIDLIKRGMDIVTYCGSDYVGLWPGQDGYDYVFDADYGQTWAWWVEGLQELADHNPGVRLGLEPKPDEPRGFSLINSVAKALVMTNDVGRANVGVTLDIGHSLYSHDSIAEGVSLSQAHGNRLFHLHMNDNYNTADLDMIFGSVRTLEFLEMFYWLRRTGYNRFMSVDLFAYRTDPERSVGEAVRWMQAYDSFIDRVGTQALGELIDRHDPTETTAFLRSHLFGV